MIREIKSVLMLLHAFAPQFELLFSLISSVMVLVNVDAARRLDRFAMGVVNQSLRSPASAAALLRRIGCATEERKAWGRVAGDLYIGGTRCRSAPALVHSRVQHFRKTLRVRRIQHSTLIRAGRAPVGDDPGSDSEYEQWSEDEEYYDTVMEFQSTFDAPDMRVGCWSDVERARAAAASATAHHRQSDSGGGAGDGARECNSTCTAARQRHMREVRLVRPPAWGKGAVSTRTSPERPAPGCGQPYGVGSAKVFSVHHEVFEGAAYEGAGELLLHPRGPRDDALSGGGRISCSDGASVDCAGAVTDGASACMDACMDVWLLAPERPTARIDLIREYSAHATPLYPAPPDLRAGDPPLVTLDEVEFAQIDVAAQNRRATVDGAIDGNAVNDAVAALVGHHELQRQLYFNRMHGLCPPSGRRRRALVAYLYSRGVGLLQLSGRRAAREALNTDATNRRIFAFLGLGRPGCVPAGAGAERAAEEIAHEAKVRREPRYSEVLSQIHATGDEIRGVFRVAAESYYAVANAQGSGDGERSAVEAALVARGRRRRVFALLYAIVAAGFGARTAYVVLCALYLRFQRAITWWRDRRSAAL